MPRGCLSPNANLKNAAYSPCMYGFPRSVITATDSGVFDHHHSTGDAYEDVYDLGLPSAHVRRAVVQLHRRARPRFHLRDLLCGLTPLPVKIVKVPLT